MRWALIVVVAAGLAGALLLVAQTLLLSWIVRDVLIRHATLDGVTRRILLTGCVMAGRSGLIALREAVARRAAIQVKLNVRERLAAHILRLGPGYVSGERTGELVATATDGIEKLDAYVSRYLPGVVLGAGIPLVIVLAILPVDPLSAGLLVFTVPVIVLLMVLIGTFTRDHVQRQWEALGRLSDAFLDMIQGLPTLLLLDRDGAERRRVESISERFRDRTLGVLKVAFLSGAVLELMTAAGIGLIATVLGVRLLNGDVPFDRAFFVFLLTPEFYRPLRDLGAQRHAVMEGGAAVERILQILEMPVIGVTGLNAAVSPGSEDQSVGAGSAAPSLATIPVWNEGRARQEPAPTSSARVGEPPSIQFKDVSYTYPGRERPALSRVTLSLPAGTCTALIGPSGSGKTTLINLLLRSMDPTEGIVTVNGRALPRLDVEDWRERVALVPQRPHLFHGTLRDNIRLARPGASSEEIDRAAELAGCSWFIAHLPDGFDTLLGEGGEGLSAGQRQRVAIARALLKDAPLLVLDEPTSALDPESEAQIRAALRMLMRDRTVLVVAHRRNTVRAADRVARLQDGRLVAMGPAEALLHERGQPVLRSRQGAGEA